MDYHDQFYTALALLRQLDDLIDFSEPITPEKPFEFLDSTEINRAIAKAKEFLGRHALIIPHRDD